MTKDFRSKLRRRVRVAIRKALDDMIEGEPSPLADIVRLILGRLVRDGLKKRVAEIGKNPVGAILAGDDGPGAELRKLIDAAEELGAVGHDAEPLFEVAAVTPKLLPEKPGGLLDTGKEWHAQRASPDEAADGP